MTDELVAFLRARLDEDEQRARATKEASCIECGHSLDDHRAGYPYLGCVARGCDCPSYGHAAVIDPVRVLADVEAKRQIVWECQNVLTAPVIIRPPAPGMGGDPAALAAHLAQAGLRLLALPYAGHPDYQPEWKP